MPEITLCRSCPMKSGVTYEDVSAVYAFCARRTPAEAGGEVHCETLVVGESITIVEHAIPWDDNRGFASSSRPLAQLRFDPALRAWTLFCGRRPEGWVPVPGIEPTAEIETLLEVIEDDPTGDFAPGASARTRTAPSPRCASGSPRSPR